ncbi:UMP-CMP kinase [Leptopilina heterotoma]|uniref:UMP-CMP kinase n=1 Tax=Leptopilina heterotoma TaxID=63436 RepID=UPI001CAA2A89|nr:UMP-CMP kinase [Leptopilina heterotoma]
MFKFCQFAVRNLTMSISKKPEVVFILGRPGAGKGTQCEHIVNKYGYVHLSAGDLLREERVKPGSEFGDLIENHIKNGTIVPVEITCSLLDRAMQISDNEHKRFLIDGFPRNADNLQGWTKTMEDKVDLKGVFYFDCNNETCVTRCLARGAEGSGRSDDNLESLKKRLDNYVIDTVPIIEHYDREGCVHKFDGMKKPEEIFQEVEEVMSKIGWK